MKKRGKTPTRRGSKPPSLAEIPYRELVELNEELEERYANPMPELVERVETLSAKVDEHLKQMGIV